MGASRWVWLWSLSAYGDEAMVTGYHLRPASAVTMPGRTVKLELVYCSVKDASKSTL